MPVCRGQGCGSLYAAFNAHSFEVRATLPEAPAGKKWCRVVDTNLASPKDFTRGGNAGECLCACVCLLCACVCVCACACVCVHASLPNARLCCCPLRQPACLATGLHAGSVSHASPQRCLQPVSQLAVGPEVWNEALAPLIRASPNTTLAPAAPAGVDSVYGVGPYASILLIAKDA